MRARKSFAKCSASGSVSAQSMRRTRSTCMQSPRHARPGSAWRAPPAAPSESRSGTAARESWRTPTTLRRWARWRGYFAGTSRRGGTRFSTVWTAACWRCASGTCCARGGRGGRPSRTTCSSSRTSSPRTCWSCARSSTTTALWGTSRRSGRSPFRRGSSRQSLRTRGSLLLRGRPGCSSERAPRARLSKRHCSAGRCSRAPGE
mmetsp:Transcript_44821/g.142725  ORF Transcript_44821/g.142725 Transcript_44821/m.142725 type:complete len:204 (+) Transcript_44821:302-913(+)